MNLEQAVERISKPPAVGVRWDARDCEAGRLLCAEIARLTALLAEAREGLRMIADRRGNFGSGVKLKALAHQYLAKLGA